MLEIAAKYHLKSQKKKKGKTVLDNVQDAELFFLLHSSHETRLIKRRKKLQIYGH